VEDRLTDRRSGERLALVALGALAVVTASWWALALWPVEAAPDWLNRTRAVCFGASASGLPDAGGWILLIGQPLGMLAFLLMVWGRTVRAALRNVARRTAGRVGLAASALLLAVGILGAGTRVASVLVIRSRAAPADGMPVRLDRAAPALSLIDQNGRLFSIGEHRGRRLMLTFAYAHCETVCPLTVHDVLSARAKIESPAPIVVVVTLDPWRDTPARLPAIARQWGLGPDDHVLSGDTADVLRTLAEWSISVSRDLDTGTVNHPTVVYILDRLGRITFAANGGADRLADLARRSEH
jgi:protein SCO1